MSQSLALAVPDSTSAALSVQQPKLLDRLRLALEARRFAPETVARFVEWNRRYILYHQRRHPQELGREEIEQFLGELARRGYGAAVQGEARRALAFLYREILGKEVACPEVGRLNLQGAEVSPQEAALLQSPKLLDRARGVLRVRRYALRTEKA